LFVTVFISFVLHEHGIATKHSYNIRRKLGVKKERKKKPLAKRKVQRHPPHPSYPQNTIFE